MNQVNGIVVTYVANALWITCAVAGVTALLALALPRAASSHRHALWVVALLLSAGLPLASLLGSRIPDSSIYDRQTHNSGAEASVVKSAEKGHRHRRGAAVDESPPRLRYQ